MISSFKDNFAVFILTHGRPESINTLKSLEKSGYSGKTYLVCDDKDKKLDQYKNLYKEKVIIFSKDKYIGKFDKMDNFGKQAVVVYARNAVFDIVKKLKYRYFIVLDDDYIKFDNRIKKDGSYNARILYNLDSVFSFYFEFLKNSNINVLCMAQGGDYFGGSENSHVSEGFKTSRKMMNVYFFDVEKPIEFKGTLNEDLTSSIDSGSVGKIILTSYMTSITQKETQQNKGGLTDIYLEVGTYTKSFYSVIASPSCVKISSMGGNYQRIHHQVLWKNAVPKIIRETV